LKVVTNPKNQHCLQIVTVLSVYVFYRLIFFAIYGQQFSQLGRIFPVTSSSCVHNVQRSAYFTFILHHNYHSSLDWIHFYINK